MIMKNVGVALTPYIFIIEPLESYRYAQLDPYCLSKLATSFWFAPFHGPETLMNVTLPQFLCNCSRVGTIDWQCGHQGSMNSKNTTFPRNEDNETDPPVEPLGPTTGNVKSGA